MPTAAWLLCVALLLTLWCQGTGAAGSVGTAGALRPPLHDTSAPRSFARAGRAPTPSTAADAPAWSFLQQYPAQGKAVKLAQGQSIAVDGSLADPAWQEVQWTAASFQDIAQPMHPNVLVPSDFQTQVKVRWDDSTLYIGAVLQERMVWGNITGHNQRLSQGKAPWWNNDFEVFVDVSGSSHFYKEYEMNARNATYDVLWHFPDPGFDSVGVPCDQSVAWKWCTNSTFSKQNWTMMAANFDTGAGVSGLRSAVGTGGWNGSVFVPWLPQPTHWVVEIAMPIRRSPWPDGGDPRHHGGLLDADDSVDFSRFDPAQGARYWWVNFARAEHPLVMLGPDAVSAPDYDGEYYADTCKRVQQEWPTLLGDGPWSCYWEWVWQNMQATRYMHNPEMWGLLEFTTSVNNTAPLCRNVEWPARHVLSQLLRAQIQHLRVTGSYTDDPTVLLHSMLCNATLSCNLDVLTTAIVDYPSVFNISVDIRGGTTCVDYRGKGSYTGGPCMTLTSVFQPPNAAGPLLTATLREDRFMTVRHTQARVDVSGKQGPGLPVCLCDTFGSC